MVSLTEHILAIGEEGKNHSLNKYDIWWETLYGGVYTTD